MLNRHVYPFSFLEVARVRTNLPWVPEVFLACDGNFRAGHYKDLTETGNRARNVSGTQGRTNSTKFLNFVMQNAEKQILPSESSAEEVSFEW